jgi:hypothetical protein
MATRLFADWFANAKSRPEEPSQRIEKRVKTCLISGFTGLKPDAKHSKLPLRRVLTR